MSRSPRGCAICLFFVAASGMAQQGADKPAVPEPISMPADRAADSYRIYSSLIPLGETGGKDWPRALWLVRNTTITAVPPDRPCWIEADASRPNFESSNNPHLAVHPPDDQRQNFAEILEDFDNRCHESVAMESDGWELGAPLRLLNEQEQKEFESSRDPKNAAAAVKYKGAPALYAFSQVYFNAHHTVALVYATHWCGGLCGEGFWVALELKDGKWKQLQWNSTRWIS